MENVCRRLFCFVLLLLLDFVELAHNKPGPRDEQGSVLITWDGATAA